MRQNQITLPNSPFSVLDLAPVAAGSKVREALHNTRDLARHAEALGYHRYWLAEHHGMTGIASAATSVVIGYVAENTSTIRVGSCGIMLPNHAPLVIAEQFGTLESLYPGRIDLGLGRAPGTDQVTSRALRRDRMGGGDSFPSDVQELQSYFADAQAGQRVRAVPGEGLKVPIWLLGSSMYSAQLAAALGLPFAFASHFAPDLMKPALEIYRRQFQPSESLAKPYAMLGINAFAAETDADAARLFTSLQQAFINLRVGNPGPLPAPIDDLDSAKTSGALSGAADALRCSVVGSPETVRAGLQEFVAQYQPDELMITAQIFDHAARLRSFEIVMQARAA